VETSTHGRECGNLNTWAGVWKPQHMGGSVVTSHADASHADMPDYAPCRRKLGQNALDGQIPPQLSTLTSLTELGLNSNNFLGSIPAQLSELSSIAPTHFSVLSNTHLCGTYTAANAPADTTGTALGTACSSQMQQTLALLAFRDSMTSDDPILTYNKDLAMSDWNLGAPAQLVCTTGGATWPGVTCSGTDVVAVDRASIRVYGTLVPEFSSLTALTSLELQGNYIAGTLPPQWSTLSAAEYIYAYNNELVGTLPSEWSALSSITRLWLSGNTGITGTTPSSWTFLSTVFAYPPYVVASKPKLVFF